METAVGALARVVLMRGGRGVDLPCSQCRTSREKNIILVVKKRSVASQRRTWDGLATPVPEVRDFWKKASYEWRRRLASASRLALRWPLLPPFARRQCPRLTPAQHPEVCVIRPECSRLKCAQPPRLLTCHGACRAWQVAPTDAMVLFRTRSRCCHRESCAAT